MIGYEGMQIRLIAILSKGSIRVNFLILQEPSIHCFGEMEPEKLHLNFQLKFNSIECKNKVQAEDTSILHICEIWLPIRINIFKNFIQSQDQAIGLGCLLGIFLSAIVLLCTIKKHLSLKAKYNKLKAIDENNDDVISIVEHEWDKLIHIAR
jgi:hypothetical protein